jgi:putative IMPACT (imprinted ancient) family translation regulator
MQKVPNAESRYEFMQKKSKFIGFLAFAADENGAMSYIKKLEEEYYSARHICYAYKIGEITRFADAGEPSGTAGRPILNSLENANLNFAVCGVIRYFGGILLGRPGLQKAYGDAAKGAVQEAIDANALRELLRAHSVTVETKLESEPKVKSAIYDYFRKHDYKSMQLLSQIRQETGAELDLFSASDLATAQNMTDIHSTYLEKTVKLEVIILQDEIDLFTALMVGMGGKVEVKNDEIRVLSSLKNPR